MNEFWLAIRLGNLSLYWRYRLRPWSWFNNGLNDVTCNSMGLCRGRGARLTLGDMMVNDVQGERSSRRRHNETRLGLNMTSL